MNLPLGKLDPELLNKFLSRIPKKDRRIIIGSRVGDDAAVIDFGDKYLIAKTDPITFVSDKIGWYCVNINANDIAVMGGIPKWFLATALMPEGKTTEKDIEKLFKSLISSLNKINVTLCGGHTEITPNLDRPIVIGQMIGEVLKSNLINKDSVKPGDLIILTKGIAIEAVSIIAREKKSFLNKSFGREFVKRIRNFIKVPGLSIIREANIALKSGRISAMHDPTEGGLLGGLYELALLSNTGFIIEKEKIYIYPECKKLSEKFKLNPLKLIASGALIIISEPDESKKIVNALRKNKIKSEIIGKVTSSKSGFKIIERGKTKSIKTPIIDEIGKIL
ncbi:MAG: hydrogenase expression/formation protein [Candidatus Helarchaeota archaeon]|nr:hydrogenase expression/formation protein [Candidatus Helarchaeota archaeon]